MTIEDSFLVRYKESCALLKGIVTRTLFNVKYIFKIKTRMVKNKQIISEQVPELL